MRIAFHYHLASGALIALPLEVDGNRPFALVVEDAHEIARTAFGPCSFSTVVLPRRGPVPIGAVIAPIVERAIRVSGAAHEIN